MFIPRNILVTSALFCLERFQRYGVLKKCTTFLAATLYIRPQVPVSRVSPICCLRDSSRSSKKHSAVRMCSFLKRVTTTNTFSPTFGVI